MNAPSGFGRRVFAFERSQMWKRPPKCKRSSGGLIAGVGSVSVVVIGGDRSGTDRLEHQLGAEQLIADTALRFQRTTMAPASRASDRAAQHAYGFRGNPQIEGKAASGVVAGGPINHALAGAGVLFGGGGGLHIHISCTGVGPDLF